jgi:RND family efflux transporter MFP subunit
MKLSKVLPIIIVGIIISGCSSDVEQAAQEAAPRPAKLITLGTSNTNTSLRYPAIVAADQTANLSFPVGGTLVTLNVVEAQQVTEGEVLAVLDTRDIVNKLTSSKAQYDNAEDEFQRGKRLYEQDALAKNAFEQRRVQRDVSKAQLDSAKKALSDATLRAPFSGLIASVAADEQQSIQGGATIITLIGIDELTATVNIPARIMAQSSNRTDLKTFITFDSAPGIRLAAEFKEATLIADSASQTYAVTISFKRAKDTIILPGMTATVETVMPAAEDGKNKIAVPMTAINSDADNRFVWLVDPGTMRVSRQDVVIEDGIGEMVVVTVGLKAGDTIVSAGGAYLAEAMEIRQWDDQADHQE